MNTFTACLIAFFFLGLLNPPGLLAEGGAVKSGNTNSQDNSYWSLFPNRGIGAPCPVDTPRARKLWTNAPQAPEAMLQVVKEFMENPRMSGFELGEKLYGLDRDFWGPVESEISHGPEEYGNKKTLGYAPFFKGGGQKGPPNKPWKLFAPPVSYHLGNSMAIGILDNGTLNGIALEGFRDGFCVTPALVRKILGEPGTVGKGRHYVAVNYSAGLYKIGVVYPDENYQSPEWERGIFSDVTRIDDEFNRLRGMCASTVNISR